MDKKLTPSEISEMWRAALTGDDPTMGRNRSLYKFLPSNPRCKVCNMPFGGIGGAVMRAVGRGRSNKNPRLCNVCDILARNYPGGAEVELTMLFADVRGSTSIAERMDTVEFGRLINRFFAVANQILIDSDAIIDKLVGDEVVGFYMPGLCGPDHAARALHAARELLRATGHGDPGGPWIPVGVGIHTGRAFVGSIGTDQTFSDFTALGDNVNIAARLGAKAAAGEILVTDAACEAAGHDLSQFESRQLELKGKSDLVHVRVVRVGRALAA